MSGKIVLTFRNYYCRCDRNSRTLGHMSYMLRRYSAGWTLVGTVCIVCAYNNKNSYMIRVPSLYPLTARSCGIVSSVAHRSPYTQTTPPTQRPTLFFGVVTNLSTSQHCYFLFNETVEIAPPLCVHYYCCCLLFRKNEKSYLMYVVTTGYFAESVPSFIQARRDGMAVQALLTPQPGPTGYYHRELLILTPEGRRVDLLTVTDCHGILVGDC